MGIPDRQRLIDLAGKRVFRRGEDYFIWRRVRAMAVDGDTLTAFVYGARRYRVAVTIKGQEVGYECDCPEGASARFCKHCVALCLNWLHVEPSGELSTYPWKDAREFLINLPQEELSCLIMDEVARNAGFRDRLFLRMARANGKKAELAGYREILEFASQSAVSGEGSASFTGMLEDVKDSLNILLEAGYAEEAAGLIEEAPVFRQSIQTETSEMLIAALLRLHHRICLRSGIVAEALAGRLLRWQLATSANGLPDVIRRYSDLLGARGRREYAHLVQSEWDRLRSNGGVTALDRRAKLERLSDLVKDMAERQGDIDLLIEVKSARLKEASGYVEIARLCKRKGREALALSWALRGRKLFAAYEAEDLYEFLATEYEARGEWGAAIEILYEIFSARPSLDGYQRMAAFARQIGEWDLWRERALSVTRRKPAAPPPRMRSARPPAPDQSVSVGIFLWEDDVNAALQAAQQGGCDNGLWLELANRLAVKQPDEALQIYKRLVRNFSDGKNSYDYQRAMDLIRRIGRLMKKQKRRDEFLTYVEGLYEKHRYRYSFAKLLAQLLARHSPKRSRASLAGKRKSRKSPN
jgi:uncharacterized Zn finger protein